MIDTNIYKEKLEAEKAQLTADLQTLGIHNPEVPEDWIALPQEAQDSEADDNLSADRVEEWNERTATLSALETRYNNITRALGKIAAGTYGICEIGNEEIEEDRLAINPSARTCKAHINEEQDLPA